MSSYPATVQHCRGNAQGFVPQIHLKQKNIQPKLHPLHINTKTSLALLVQAQEEPLIQPDLMFLPIQRSGFSRALTGAASLYFPAGISPCSCTQCTFRQFWNWFSQLEHSVSTPPARPTCRTTPGDGATSYTGISPHHPPAVLPHPQTRMVGAKNQSHLTQGAAAP